MKHGLKINLEWPQKILLSFCFILLTNFAFSESKIMQPFHFEDIDVIERLRIWGSEAVESCELEFAQNSCVSEEIHANMLMSFDLKLFWKEMRKLKSEWIVPGSRSVDKLIGNQVYGTTILRQAISYNSSRQDWPLELNVELLGQNLGVRAESIGELDFLLVDGEKSGIPEIILFKDNRLKEAFKEQSYLVGSIFLSERQLIQSVVVENTKPNQEFWLGLRSIFTLNLALEYHSYFF